MGAEWSGLHGDRRTMRSPGDGITGSSARLLPLAPSGARWEQSRSARSKQSLAAKRGANCFHFFVDLHLCEVLFVWFVLKIGALGRRFGSGPTNRIPFEANACDFA